MTPSGGSDTPPPVAGTQARFMGGVWRIWLYIEPAVIVEMRREEAQDVEDAIAKMRIRYPEFAEAAIWGIYPEPAAVEYRKAPQ